MFFKSPASSYKIIVPPGTSSDIVEWFSKMNLSGNLSDELISLVNNFLKTEKSQLSNAKSESDTLKINSEQSDTDDIFIENLHNWHESNKKMFHQEEEKTKKMLII